MCKGLQEGKRREERVVCGAFRTKKKAGEDEERKRMDS